MTNTRSLELFEEQSNENQQRLPSIRVGFPGFDNGLEMLDFNTHNRSPIDRTQRSPSNSHHATSNEQFFTVQLRHQLPVESSLKIPGPSPLYSRDDTSQEIPEDVTYLRRSSQDSTTSSTSSARTQGHGLISPPMSRYNSPALSQLRGNHEDNEETEIAKMRIDAIVRRNWKSPSPHTLNEQRRRIECARMASVVEKSFDEDHIRLCQEHGGIIGRSEQNDRQPAKMAVLFFAWCREKYCLQGGNIHNLDEELDIRIIKTAAEEYKRVIRPDSEEVEEHAKQNAVRKAIKREFPDSPKTTKRTKVAKVTNSGVIANKRSKL